MATNVTLNGTTYSIPAEGDDGWGTNLANYFIAIASHTLQKTGGSFTLTAEVNFGATYGLKTAYLKSQATNPSATGILRLGNTETISWRNAANSADLALTVNASNALQFNGATLIGAGGASIVNADISATAAIAYSKLNLAGSIVNADISASAAIAYSKLNLSGSIVNADVSASAAIAYSKLNLSASIVNADIAAGAAIAYSKLNIADGDLAIAKTSGLQAALDGKEPTITTLSVLKGGTGQTTTTAAFDALSPNTTKGDLTVRNDTTNIRLPVGSDGQVLTADSAEASGIKWASSLTNPMNASGDMIVGGVAGAATRLPKGTDGQYLRLASGTPAWETPTLPTIQKFTSGTAQTYNTPAGVKYIRVRMVGGGAGGSGSASNGNSGNLGSVGTASTFGTLSAGGGQLGANYLIGGAGGTSSLGVGPIGTALPGGGGHPGITAGGTAVAANGGNGGSSAFGGAGIAGNNGAVSGSAGGANTGAGGGGAGGPSGGVGGGGGGAGGFIDALILSPASSYTYTVGAGGSGGANGTGGAGGGAGGAGYIEVTEYY